MERFLTIGLVICGGLLFLTQLLNYYIHIGRNKNNIKNKIVSFSSSSKRLIVLSFLFSIAVFLLFIKQGLTPLIIIFCFIILQFIYAVFLTTNLYIFEEYLLVPWNHLEFKKINTLKLSSLGKKNNLGISYEGGRTFNMSLNIHDSDILIESIKKQNKNIKILKNTKS